MTYDIIGVDISKSILDVHRLSDNAIAQFDNNRAGFSALQNWLNDSDVSRVIYEPTGPYHRDSEIAMAARFPLIKVNPLQVRRFAQAHGVRAKSDKVVARMLAVMGRTFSLEAKFSTSEI